MRSALFVPGSDPATLGKARGTIAIRPLAMELAASAFDAGGYRGASPRLCGLTQGVEDLAVDLGSEVSDTNLPFLPAVELGRSLCLYAAAAAQVPAVDAVYAAFPALRGLAAAAARAARRLLVQGGDSPGAGRDHQPGLHPDSRHHRPRRARGRGGRCGAGGGLATVQLSAVRHDDDTVMQAEFTLRVRDERLAAAETAS